MASLPLVVVDADAIVAQAYDEDVNHKKAVEIARNLVDIKAQVIYPITAITEAVTVIQRVLSSGDMARSVAAAFTEAGVEIVEVSRDIYAQAVNKYFDKDMSKKNTLFDCIVAAVAEEYKAGAIFSFDKFYKKRGFKLISDLD